MTDPAEAAPTGVESWQLYWDEVCLIPPHIAEVVDLNYDWRRVTKNLAEGTALHWGKAIQIGALMVDLGIEANKPEPDPNLPITALDRIEDFEAQYPNHQDKWDNWRAGLAYILARTKNTPGALQLVSGIQSDYILAETAVHIDDLTPDGNDAELIYGEIMGRLEKTSPERVARFLQSVIHILIAHDPENEEIGIFEKAALAYMPDYDAVDSWVEPLRWANPDYDWDDVANTLRKDAMWGDVPLRQRQHVIKKYIQYQHAVAAEMSTEIIQNLCELFNGYEEKFPGAPAWDMFRVSLGKRLITLGWPDAALDIGRTVRSDLCKKTLAEDMNASGDGEASLELIAGMQDPQLAYLAIIEPVPQNEDLINPDIERFLRVVVDEGYPRDWRVALLKAASTTPVFGAGIISFQEEGLLLKYLKLMGKLQQEVPDLAALMASTQIGHL